MGATSFKEKKMGWTEWYKFEDLFKFVGLTCSESTSGFKTTIDGVKGGLTRWNGFLERNNTVIYPRNLQSHAEIPCGIYMIRVKGETSKKVSPKSQFFDYIGRAGGIMNSTTKSNGFLSRIPDDHFRKLINIPERGSVGRAMQEAYQACGKKNWRSELEKDTFTTQSFRDFLEGKYQIEANFKSFFDLNQDMLRNTEDIQDFFKRNVRIKFLFLRRKLRVRRNNEPVDIRYENIYKTGGTLREEVLSGNEDSLEQSKIYHRQEKEYNERLCKAEGLCLQAYFTKYGEYPFLNSSDEVNYALNNFLESLDS